MEPFDFVIIGAGPAGEAAAYEARARGATVAVIDRRWFGGSCPHIGCLPSKSLLHGAAEHAANPATYSWERASAARDFMVNRAGRRRRARRLVARQARSRTRARSAIAATGAIVGRGLVEVRHDDEVHEIGGAERRGRGRLAVEACRRCRASTTVRIWTNREATLARELPKSLARARRRPDRLRAAQVYARFGVPVTDRPVRRPPGADRAPRNSEAVAQLLRRDGVDCGSASGRPRPGRAPARTAPTSIDLDDGTTAEGHVGPAGGRPDVPLDDLGLEHYGIDTTRPDAVPARRAAARRATGCGSSATRPARSSTPTRPTTRASSRSGWRWASRSRPTTGRSPGRPTPIPRPPRSG